jgi:hypothetical protein
MEVCMKPAIEHTQFGSITVAGESFDHDILIRLDGRVKKRQKKLSKELYGTSHIISLAEAEHIFEEGASKLIIGSGQSGMLHLSDEAAQYFKKQNCQVELQPTAKAMQAWNKAGGAVIGMFHVTC